MEVELIGFGILIVILIGLYAFFSSLESAITLIDKATWITKTKNQKNKTFKLGIYFINHYVIALNNILIVQTLCSVGAAALATLFFTKIATLCGLNDAEGFGAGLSSGLLTLFLLIVGDSIPKTLAKNNPYKVYKFSIFIFLVFYFIFLPFGYILTKIIKSKKNISSTSDQLKNLVKIMNDEGTIDDEAESLIKRAINFTNTNVKAILNKHEQSIYHIHETYDYYQVYDAFINSGYSRIPVLDKNEKIIGIALQKLFLEYLDPRNDEKSAAEFKMADILELPLIVYTTDHIDDVLRKMQLQRMHIAIVANSINDDTFAGIITFEDVIEEIFGPIYDENEEDIVTYEQIDDNTWKIPAETNLYLFLKNNLNLRYKIDKNINVYDFMQKVKKNDLTSKKKNQIYEDKYIIIEKTKSLRTKKDYFIVKKKDLHDLDASSDSLSDILFSSEEENDLANFEIEVT